MATQLKKVTRDDGWETIALNPDFVFVSSNNSQEWMWGVTADGSDPTQGHLMNRNAGLSLGAFTGTLKVKTVRQDNMIAYTVGGGE